jgi:hypothetical protein
MDQPGGAERLRLWTEMRPVDDGGTASAPSAQLAALDPPLPDEEGAAGAGVDDEEDELSDDDEEDDDDDEDDEAPSDALALLRLSVR